MDLPGCKNEQEHAPFASFVACVYVQIFWPQKLKKIKTYRIFVDNYFSSNGQRRIITPNFRHRMGRF
jgi:hypothetical protein